MKYFEISYHKPYANLNGVLKVYFNMINGDFFTCLRLHFLIVILQYEILRNFLHCRTCQILCINHIKINLILSIKI
jgi:hypothetical protein